MSIKRYWASSGLCRQEVKSQYKIETTWWQLFSQCETHVVKLQQNHICCPPSVSYMELLQVNSCHCQVGCAHGVQQRKVEQSAAQWGPDSKQIFICSFITPKRPLTYYRVFLLSTIPRFSFRFLSSWRKIRDFLSDWHLDVQRVLQFSWETVQMGQGCRISLKHFLKLV